MRKHFSKKDLLMGGMWHWRHENILCRTQPDIHKVEKVMYPRHILPTGQSRCYDENGRQIVCRGTGQDGEYLINDFALNWPIGRFDLVSDALVHDRVTDLIWPRNSCLSDYPMTWQEALDFIEEKNRETWLGKCDWRMPNRRELRSLVDHSARQPALTPGHPFQNVFLGWYWTSTTAAIATRYAWYVHFEGGRMFYGNKDGYYWLWPVCGRSDILACTGARQCYDERGAVISCTESRQDASLLMGKAWPRPRFAPSEFGIVDELTGLIWHGPGSFGGSNTTWSEALAMVDCYAQETGMPWRLPTINELESLVDASSHSPALAPEHPFSDIQQSFWSSTTSGFAADWAYVLYLVKGAVGVGYKKNSDFALWPVLSVERK